MTTYGMPYFLEDKTGLLTGSEFTDIHDRLCLIYRRSTVYEESEQQPTSSPTSPSFSSSFSSSFSLPSPLSSLPLSRQRTQGRTAYMIYNASSSVGGAGSMGGTGAGATRHSFPRALIALDFGPGNSLGNVVFDERVCVPMKAYLVKTSSSGRVRKFTASDGQDYFWGWRTQPNQEWTCTNTSGYLIAYYSLKTPGEPSYEGSSGCSLTIDEAFGHLAAGELHDVIMPTV